MDIDRIVIEKDCLQFGQTKVAPPFEREKIDALLGAPRIDEWDFENFKGEVEHNVTCLWDKLGIRGDPDNKGGTTYTSFSVYVADGERFPHAATGTFAGKVMIGKKEYTQCKMKYNCCSHELKNGVFTICTFLSQALDDVEEDFKDMAEKCSRFVEIHYEPPKPKTTKYKLKKCDEPVLVFDNFNFKLLVIQQLMYKKELLTPRFDIYEFAQEYSRRRIDVDDDGYEPIKEAKKWFRDIEIPARLADEVTELLCDGGLDVYMQIYPFWDGEDDYFDVKRISEGELAQFNNLRKVNVTSCISKAAIKTLKAHGIEVSE